MAASSLYCLFSLVILLSAHNICANSSSDEKVTVTVYYGTFSSESSMFITSKLLNIFDIGLIDVVDLNLVPFGNANITSNGTFICEHGTDECLLNTVEACAIHVCPEPEKHYPFVYCLQSSIDEGDASNWKNCFDEKLDFDPKVVEDCYKGETGKQILISNAEKTRALDPPHSYLPWVVMDGRPIFDDYQDYHNFESHICKAYRGSQPPEACSHSS